MSQCRLIPLVLGTLALLVSLSQAGQTQWSWTYSPAAGENASASITPMKFDKKWAYTMENDDCPKKTLTIAQPLFANYRWSDAPPGVGGGNLHPLVGSSGAMVVRVEGNSTYLSWADMQTLIQNGWGVVNHGYWHTGNHWDPANFLDADQFRRELFWAQQIIGMKLYNGEYTSSHLIYPNGDYHYEDYLEEFGIVSGSHAAGSVRNLNGNPNLERLNRNNMDGTTWSTTPMVGIGTPVANDFIIDFTHGVGDPGSVNYIAWQTRLGTIENTYGANGTDELWSAPTEEVIRYHLARKQANVSVNNGTVTVTLPDDALASALTIKLTNVNPSSTMTAPQGGLLYRQGTTAWITTPVLNPTRFNPVPEPRMRLVYEGPFTAQPRFSKPFLLAGLRVWIGSGTAGISVQMLRPDGGSEYLDMDRITQWTGTSFGFGSWALYPTLPDLDPVLINGLNLSPTTGYGTMEIYAVVIPGDYNNDGFVDLADYTVWADHYGQTGSNVAGDGNEDGLVDLADYTVWADHYGQGWQRQAGNRAPSVNAGADRQITLPTNSVDLDANVSDDGLPSATLTTTWSKVSGPGSVTFANASAIDTTATFSAAGVYVLRLTADDSELTRSDDVTVTVHPQPVNTAPTVNAGSNNSIELPVNTVTLNASVTDDGLPSASLSLAWTKISGPGSVTFGNASAASTTATFSMAGEYILRLTADDGEYSVYDEVTIIVYENGTMPTVHIITPIAVGAATGGGYTAPAKAFNNPPVWDEVNGLPVGDEPDGNSSTGTEYANRYWYIDFGPNYANLRITETWTRYRPWSGYSFEGFAELWWDDDIDTVNDSGLAETRLNFQTAQSLPSVGYQLWAKDTDANAAPIVPQARYLLIGTGEIVTSRPNEFLIIGYSE